jgi:hypothetical protein
MQLTLREKWAIDSQILNTGAIATRLYPSIYGAIVGDSRNSGLKDRWSGASANLFKLMEGLIKEQPADEFLKKFDAIDLISYISPLAFTFAEKFDFPLIRRTVEKYAEIALDDVGSRLECIIYLEILFCLYHSDNFEGACKTTNELCGEYLHDTEYSAFLPEYDSILKRPLKDMSAIEPNDNCDANHALESALWCCLNSSGVLEAISKAVLFKKDSAVIAVLAGTMAGMYFREDISSELPKINYDYNKTLARFLEYCAKTNS